jgi:hypothetical protein
MSRRQPPRALGAALMIALALAGCQAPAGRGALRVGPAASATARATLTAHVGGKAGYALRYISGAEWNEAEATLSQGETTIGTQTVAATRDPATGDRTATISLADVPAGTGYALVVRLLRRDAAGDAVEVGRAENPDVTLVEGPNEVVLGAPTFEVDDAANPGDVTGFVAAYVGSWPVAGPGARIDHPTDAVQDGDGATYVADAGNHRIVRVDADGNVVVIAGAADGEAGYANGDGVDARFGVLGGLLLASDGYLYAADPDNDVIRRITLAEPYTVETFAGSGVEGFQDDGLQDARFDGPVAIAEGAPGLFYVADQLNQRIRLIDTTVPSPAVSTVAGDGTEGFKDGDPSSAWFDDPAGLVMEAGVLYVADRDNHRIRAVAFDALGVPTDVSTVAGDGTPAFANANGTSARFDGPTDVVARNGVLYVADAGNRRVRSIDAPAGAASVGTLTGDGVAGQADGPQAGAFVVEPFGLSVAPGDAILVADREGARIREVDDGVVSGLAGDGAHGSLPGRTDGEARPLPTRLAFDDADAAFVTDQASNRIFKLTAAGAVTPFSGTGELGFVGGAASQWRGPAGIVRRAADALLYVADEGNHVIRAVAADGSTVAAAGDPAGDPGDGDGVAAAAGFRQPFGLAITADGNTIYVAERCGRIRKIAFGSSTAVTTVAGAATGGFAEGSGGAGGDARFEDPHGIALGGDGKLYVADTGNHRIRVITPADGGAWDVSTLAGDGTPEVVDGDGVQARFDAPTDLVLAPDGALWVADADGRVLRRIVQDEAGVHVTTVAGTGEAGYHDGPGSGARFASPVGLTFGPGGRLYVADRDNGGIRTIGF